MKKILSVAIAFFLLMQVVLAQTQTPDWVNLAKSNPIEFLNQLSSNSAEKDKLPSSSLIKEVIQTPEVFKTYLNTNLKKEVGDDVFVGIAGAAITGFDPKTGIITTLSSGAKGYALEDIKKLAMNGATNFRITPEGSLGFEVNHDEPVKKISDGGTTRIIDFYKTDFSVVAVSSTANTEYVSSIIGGKISVKDEKKVQDIGLGRDGKASLNTDGSITASVGPSKDALVLSSKDQISKRFQTTIVQEGTVRVFGSDHLVLSPDDKGTTRFIDTNDAIFEVTKKTDYFENLNPAETTSMEDSGTIMYDKNRGTLKIVGNKRVTADISHIPAPYTELQIDSKRGEVIVKDIGNVVFTSRENSLDVTGMLSRSGDSNADKITAGVYVINTGEKWTAGIKENQEVLSYANGVRTVFSTHTEYLLRRMNEERKTGIVDLAKLSQLRAIVESSGTNNDMGVNRDASNSRRHAIEALGIYGLPNDIPRIVDTSRDVNGGQDIWKDHSENWNERIIALTKILERFPTDTDANDIVPGVLNMVVKQPYSSNVNFVSSQVINSVLNGNTKEGLKGVISLAEMEYAPSQSSDSRKISLTQRSVGQIAIHALGGYAKDNKEVDDVLSRIVSSSSIDQSTIEIAKKAVAARAARKKQ